MDCIYIYYLIIKLVIKGQELRVLYHSCLQVLDSLIRDDRKKRRKGQEGMDQEGANEYQNTLIVLLLFTLGGQRKEIVVGMTIYV